jgi:two-component system, NarL family, nitrate/nitrite response regulator NarL
MWRVSGGNMNSISLALVDNHPITVEGLAQLFAAQEGYHVIAKGSTTADALAIAQQLQPALMVLDLAVPGNSLAIISEIAAKYPNIKMITFTAVGGIDYAVSALEAGARGYVPKTCTLDEIFSAAKAVTAGDIYISPNFASSVITALKNASVRKIAMQALKLSTREDQIVHLLLVGKTNKEIASRLGITEKTVKHYMTVLMQKLSARNRVEVVIAAQKLKHSSYEFEIIEPQGTISVN